MTPIFNWPAICNPTSSPSLRPGLLLAPLFKIAILSNKKTTQQNNPTIQKKMENSRERNTKQRNTIHRLKDQQKSNKSKNIWTKKLSKQNQKTVQKKYMRA